MLARLPPPTLLLFFSLAAIVVVLDQISKAFVISSLSGQLPYVVIPRFFQFSYATNTGAAFSMLERHPGGIKVFASLVAIVLIIWSWRLSEHERALRWPLGLILGGALGNLTDRYLRGHVIDFIDAHWDNVYHFPTFNVADSAICVGMGLLILMSFTIPQDPPEPAAEAPPT